MAAPESVAVRASAGEVRSSLVAFLVAVGGGKDSIVSIEALEAAGDDVGLFSVNTYGPIQPTADVAGLPY